MDIFPSTDLNDPNTLFQLVSNILQQSFSSPYDQYYTDENKEIITSYLKSFIKNEPLDTLLVSVLHHWIDTGNFYTLEELVEVAMTEHKCFCPENILGSSYNDEICRQFMKFFLVEYGDYPQCPDMKFSFQYYQQEHKFPLPDELQNYMRNFIEMARDPLHFRCEKKHNPTENLDKLKSFKYSTIEHKIYKLNCLPFKRKIKNIILNYIKTESNDCSMCLNKIKNDDKCFYLNCKHIFHSDESEDCGGLFKWLEQDDKCPICRRTVKVE